MAASTALQQIVNRAKQIRRAHPHKHKKWVGYVKEASAEYRSLPSKKGGGKKNKKSTRVGVVMNKQQAARTFSKPSPAHMPEVSLATMLSRTKSLLADKIGDLEARKFKETTKTGKRKIQKEISKHKRTYNKLR